MNLRMKYLTLYTPPLELAGDTQFEREPSLFVSCVSDGQSKVSNDAPIECSSSRGPNGYFTGSIKPNSNF